MAVRVNGEEPFPLPSLSNHAGDYRRELNISSGPTPNLSRRIRI